MIQFEYSNFEVQKGGHPRVFLLVSKFAAICFSVACVAHPFTLPDGVEGEACACASAFFGRSRYLVEAIFAVNGSCSILNEAGGSFTVYTITLV